MAKLTNKKKAVKKPSSKKPPVKKPVAKKKTTAKKKPPAKKKATPKNPVGRPIVKIDWDQFENLCRLQCTMVEIADWFRTSEDTIERRVKSHYGNNFAEVFKQKRSAGQISLRRSQFRLSESNPAMAIFLGKNYLKQSDKGIDDKEDPPTVNITNLNFENIATEDLKALKEHYEQLAKKKKK